METEERTLWRLIYWLQVGHQPVSWPWASLFPSMHLIFLVSTVNSEDSGPRALWGPFLYEILVLTLFKKCTKVWWVKWDNHNFNWLHNILSCLFIRLWVPKGLYQLIDIPLSRLWVSVLTNPPFSFNSFCIRDKTGFLPAQSVSYLRRDSSVP